MTNVVKSVPEMAIQLPETKLEVEGGTADNNRRGAAEVYKKRQRQVVVHGLLRLVCLVSSVVALALMTTAKQASTISLYGFSIPVYSKWSFSDSFQYVIGVCAAVAAHSLLQLLLNVWRIWRNSPIIPSRTHAWLVFVGDQVFAYATMSAGSAASGVTNLNRTGIRHSALPNFCKPLHRFCDRVAVSIAFTFLSCFVLAISVVLDVIWLCNY